MVKLRCCVDLRLLPYLRKEIRRLSVNKRIKNARSISAAPLHLRRMKKLILTILVITFGTYYVASAGGFQINSQSIKALGMGGSLTGRAFDAGTVFFNPGGMSRLQDKTVINAGISLNIPRTSFLGAQNQQEEDDGSLSLPYHFYLSTHLKNESLTVGLSINTPFGYHAKWKNDWSGRFISQEFRFCTTFIQPTASYAINEHWSIGAGPVLAIANLKTSRALPYSNTDGTEAGIELTSKATSIGANAGVYYVHNKISIGLTYRSGIKLEMKDGTADFKNIPSSLLLNGIYPTQATFSTTLQLPSSFSLAGGYTVNDKITVTLGFDMNNWSGLDSLNYDFKEEGLADIKSARKYETAFAFRAGIEGKASTKIILRGGLALDQSPVPNKYASPDMPDDDKIIVNTGLTYIITSNLHVDVAFMFENVRERRETGNIPYHFDGTYNSFIYTAGVGAQFKF